MFGPPQSHCPTFRSQDQIALRARSAFDLRKDIPRSRSSQMVCGDHTGSGFNGWLSKKVYPLRFVVIIIPVRILGRVEYPNRMRALVSETNELISWYQRDARGPIQELAGDRVAELDNRVKRLQDLTALTATEIAACFLGKSGVGKSTLINALVANQQVVLPAGGIGPLTAQAIQIGYSEQPRFRVEYHGPGALNRLIFALDRSVERAKGNTSTRPSGGEEIAAEAELDSERLQQYERQARLMITGDQNSQVPLEYLMDGLLESASRKMKWDSKMTPDDSLRIERLKSAIALAKKNEPYVRSGMVTDPEFMMNLREHAAGQFAPLIREIEVGWPSPLLERGLRLVDLPGVGISGDVYRRVTEKWVREQAKAVCLVVDRSGIDAASADLLRSSGFLNRLLHSTDDPDADPVSLIIAVVKMDEVAFEHFKQEKTLSPSGYRNKTAHLADLRQRMPQTVQTQLRDELRKLIDDLEGPARQASEAALTRIYGGLQIHPLTAREYVNLLDEDEPAFIHDAVESGIPQFKDALIALVENRQQHLYLRLMEATTDFRDSLTSLLRSLEAQWQDEDVESKETERLRGGLQEFLPSLQRELYSRQGKFHEFLKEGVPAKIDDLVNSAGLASERDMRRYLSNLEDAHWATLKATVTWGGAFVGKRHIDLPRDFSLLYDGQVAPIWGEHVIKLVRQRTSQLATDYVDLVEPIVEWAQQHGARNQAKVIAALRDQIRADAKSLAAVGREGADELRQRVKEKLLNSIRGPIQRRCAKFVNDGRHIGPGVKRRILDFFGDLVPMVVEVSRPPTLRVLKESFSTVEDEIRTHLDKYPDPLKSAEQSILKVHTDSERRSMAQRRSRVLQDLQRATQSRPDASRAAESVGAHE